MKGLTTPCFTQSLLLFTEALPWQKAVISGISYEWTDSLSAILQLPVLRNKLSQKKNSCACSPSSKLPPGLSQHNESWWWQLHLEEKQHRWQQGREEQQRWKQTPDQEGDEGPFPPPESIIIRARGAWWWLSPTATKGLGFLEFLMLKRPLKSASPTIKHKSCFNTSRKLSQ